MAKVTLEKALEMALYDPWVLCDLLQFRGGRKNFSRCHFEMMEFLTTPNLHPELRYDFIRRFMLVARGHLKTTVCILYVLWRFYRNPNIRVLLGNHHKDFGKSILREMVQYMIPWDLQRKVWHNRPHIEGILVPVLDSEQKRMREVDRDMFAAQIAQKTVWDQWKIQLIRPDIYKEPSLSTTSVLIPSTGDHMDLLWLDDIVDFLNSRKPDRAESIALWADDFASVIDPSREVTFKHPVTGFTFTETVGEERIITGTLYYDHDYYMWLLRNRQDQYALYQRNIYVNGYDSSDGYTYPEKFTDEYVERLKEDVRPSRFMSQYLNELTTAEQVLDVSLIQYITPMDINYSGEKGQAVELVGSQFTVHIANQKHFINPICVIDPAVSLGDRADYTGIAVLAKDAYNNIIVIDGVRDKLLPSQTIDAVYELRDKWGFNKVVVEAGVGFQDALLHTFRAEANNREPFILERFVPPKTNKKTFIMDMVEPVLRNGKLFIISHLRQVLCKEINYLGTDSDHDDLLNTLAIGICVLKPFRNTHSTAIIRKFRRNKVFGGTC